MMDKNDRKIRELTAEILRPILNEEVKTLSDEYQLSEVKSEKEPPLFLYFRKENLSIINLYQGDDASRDRPSITFSYLPDIEEVLSALINIARFAKREDMLAGIKNIIGSEFLVYQGEKLLHDEKTGFIEINKRIISATATWSIEILNIENSWSFIIKMPFNCYNDLNQILSTWPKLYKNNN